LFAFLEIIEKDKKIKKNAPPPYFVNACLRGEEDLSQAADENIN
jgi:hypothetical protein